MLKYNSVSEESLFQLASIMKLKCLNPNFDAKQMAAVPPRVVEGKMHTVCGGLQQYEDRKPP